VTSGDGVTSPASSRRAMEALQTWVVEALGRLDYPSADVSFLLGTDELIHRERRVAMTPAHVSRLRRDLESLGLAPRIFVVRGAGERAASEAGEVFADAEYAAAGAELVSLEETRSLDPPDVLHALKEPTAWESEVPGPLIRIGALHLASKPPGLCRMLRRGHFAAILDGGTIGNCSYLEHGGDRTPIVASMSRFAGAVSGHQVVAGLDRGGLGPGKVIVVGAGIAGMSAIEAVRPKAANLVVVEPYEPTRRLLADRLAALGYEDYQILTELTDDAFDGALGIVFAHRSGARAAEKVCHWHQIRRMARGAVIADIAIDQGGSILHDGYDEDDSVTASREKYRGLLTPDYVYYAETNMPREEPHQASEVHGDSSLPYVTALLALCAHHGGPVPALERILAKDIRVFASSGQPAPDDVLECILQDLRNGVQLAMRGGRLEITDPDIEKDEGLAEWIRQCAGPSTGPGRPYPRPGTGC